MPRLRRLSGKEVVTILEHLGYSVARVKGSHYRLELVKEVKCRVTVPVHGNQPLAIATLKNIYRTVIQCVSELEARPYSMPNKPL
jgi:predicted RNA binding protein YcfA (HicA-like mRNA interferase family)